MIDRPSAPSQRVAWATALFIALIGAWILFGLVQSSAPPADIAFSDFKTLVSAGKVDEVTLRGEAIDAHLSEPTSFRAGAAATSSVVTRAPSFGDPRLLETLEAAKVRVIVKSQDGSAWGTALIGLLPWLVLFGVYFWFWRQASHNLAGGIGRGTGLDRFLRPGRTDSAVKVIPKVSFADVAGQENAKREVKELVDFLREPERYRRMGAEPPRGILLTGAPGTGKTLLARALAGEAGVPFFSISASEFIELFVGVGASRVRTLFADAKKSAPSIIFIDELDSIGRVRGTGLGGGNDEREQTLNQILSELDGFTGREAVIVLAATNRPDVLDPALLRPGRFDRHITLELPDKKARREILAVHVHGVPLAAEVDLEKIAKGTPGFSGADLKNLVNEAAMMAAREGVAQVTGRHFEMMRERVLLGSERNLAIGPEEKHRLAVHEAGHAVAAHFLRHADPVFKVSIMPRGQALGGTQQMPDAERYIMDEDYLHARLAVILAGRAAEKLTLGTMSSGADDDIRKATSLARMMISRWGMSDKVGPMDARESDEHPFLGREIAQPRQVSEATAENVDRAVRDLLVEADANATVALTAHRSAFDRLVSELAEHETVEHEVLEGILGPRSGTDRARPAAISAA